MYRIMLILPFLFCITSCSPPDYNLAAGAVVQFHSDYNEMAYGSIYRAASDDFRRRESSEAFVARMDNVHDKLGEVDSARLLGKTFRPTLRGLLVHMEYDTRFTKGDARENFYYETVDGVAELDEYQINSAALLLN